MRSGLHNMPAILLEKDPSDLSGDDVTSLRTLMGITPFGSEHVAFVDPFQDNQGLCLITMTHGPRYLAEGNYIEVQNDFEVGATPEPQQREVYILKPRWGAGRLAIARA